MKRRTKKKIRRVITLSVVSVFLALSLIFFGFYVSTIIARFPPLTIMGNSSVSNPYVEGFDPSKLQEKLFSAGYIVESLTVSSDSASIVTRLKGAPKVIFSREKNIEWQISSLQSIIRHLTIENKNPSEVDFRYNKTIVHF